MIKCSDIEILLIVGILMFSLVNSTIAGTLTWILLGLVMVHIVFSKSLYQKIFDKIMN